jgi:tetratricopeptide (TPR) repeat protein/4-amino-4-deoxy-L-arabinose transferase-like glycosyltransferase
MKRQHRQSVAATAVTPAKSVAASTETLGRSALIVFAVAFALRLIHVWQLRRAPFFDMLMGDARGYDTWARQIASGDWIGRDVFYQAPLYPYFLGIIYKVFGHSLLTVRIVQAIVGSASCALVGAATARLVSRGAGLLAGFALALYAPAIFFDALIQKSVLDVFFVCLALWVMSRIISPAPDGAANASGVPGSSKDWLILGLTMGGLALTRENAMVLVAVLGVWALAGAGASRASSLSARTGAAAALLAGLAIVLTPVAVRNYTVGGGFYVTTSQFGSNFYIGNNPKSDGTYASLRYGRGSPEFERVDATELAEHALGRTLTPAEVSSYWTDRAMAFISSQPAAWMKLVARKFLLLWNADEMLDTESQESHAEWSTPLALLSWIGHFGVLVPLAVIGLWATWPDRRRFWVFYLMIAAYSASVIMFYVFARYRFPLVPFLLMFASAGVISLLEYARSGGWLGPLSGLFSNGAGAPRLRSRELTRAWARLAVALAKAAPPARTCADAEPRIRSPRPGMVAGAAVLVTVIFTVIFTNWPVLSKSMMQAVTENNLATAFQEDGRLDDAVAHYKRSIEFQPDYAPAYNNLGVALRAKGEIDQALASYERALAAQPDYPDAHYNMANALLEKDEPEEAAAHFRTALTSIPGSPGTLNNLGIALASQGKFEEAAAQFRAALAADPGSSKAHRNLGNALASLGRSQEAMGFLRRAIELDPSDPDIHYDLGSELLQANQLEAAAAEFRAVLTLTPASAPAHNNLAIALASQGKVDEAVAHFREAIRIDPSFPDARKNLEIALAQKKGAGR